VGETKQSSLAGKRIVITRAATQSEAIAKELKARGAIPVVVPLVAFAEPEDFAPLDEAIKGIQEFDWMIFTSAQAVRSVTKRCPELQVGPERPHSKPKIACVGPVTAEVVRQAGLNVEYVAETHNGAALAEELGGSLRGTKVLLPRSDRANPDLPAALKRNGAEVIEVIAYRTLLPSSVEETYLRQISDGTADAVLFFSPSAVHHFGEMFGGGRLRALVDTLAVTAVGPITANALRDAGVERMVLARDTTAAAVMEALERHFESVPKPAQAGVKLA